MYCVFSHTYLNKEWIEFTILLAQKEHTGIGCNQRKVKEVAGGPPLPFIGKNIPEDRAFPKAMAVPKK